MLIKVQAYPLFVFRIQLFTSVNPPNKLHQHGYQPKNACFFDGHANFRNNSVIYYTKPKTGVNLRILHSIAQKRLAVGVAGRCEPHRRCRTASVLSPVYHPILVPAFGLCNTNRHLLLFVSAVIVDLPSVESIHRLLNRQNPVHQVPIS